MFKRLVKNIRQKPKHTRDKIAFSIAGVFTAFVFAIWIYQVPTRMSNMVERQPDSAPAFSQLFDNIGEQFSSVKEAIPEEFTSDEVKEEVINDKPSTGFASPTSFATTSSDYTASSTQYSTTTLPSNNKAPATTTRSIRLITTSPSTTTSTTTAIVE